MSDQGERPSYDPAEVRRCITLCFSAKDLRELAEGLGATGLPGEGRGIQDVAREVIRHFERQGSLDRLVEALKQARPLMEWPAPLQRAGVAPAFPPPPPLAPLTPEAAAAPAAEPAAAPAAAPAPETAPAPAPEAASAPAAAPAPAPTPTVVEPPRGPDAPLLRDPYAPVWPGTASREPARPVDGRRFTLLFAIAGIVIVVASVGAFLVGRAGANSSGPAPLLAGTDAQAKGERPLRESGPSRLAADAVRRSLGNLARGCDLPLGPNEEPSTDLFKSAYEQCGMRPMIGRPPSIGRSSRPADAPGGSPPTSDDANPADTPAPAKARAAPATQPRKAPATSDKPALPDNGTACVDRCSATQKQCNRGCGSEPTLSSEYGRWQSCQAQCLSAASRCRLACQ
ncbi:hypothetical protein [Polyangium jinanense]|uniref:Uncharacterized protein n=1 Tax=Polyangium jinanense TaxID=2829994 RepID=A0A9X3X923_9BACT|nr:hypothetical protein [Polyangium jinanense]MDC3983741.1 hypothetical protein [Polyangium jinanense]